MHNTTFTQTKFFFDMFTWKLIQSITRKVCGMLHYLMSPSCCLKNSSRFGFLKMIINLVVERKQLVHATLSFSPFIQPRKRSSSCFCKSSGDTQLARRPSTPGAGSGQVCLFSGVHMYVHFSTLATSFGSVLANTLKNKAYFYFLHVT